ncbi:T9SS type A sorting domain-containing protein [Hymenobacter cheonanensis]|uniref:T9SS type A sorting domain-containing protein n=1 Tax=Hymenobacter sp. CA2-7 TaxID=3063993 RepID=UPI002713FA69|nr:T9SS type A sorting domain-containing protein [Hymenobacter sp. CA2-7]MDO7884589.1 T9SS type A sorting domain-containing protein [Hymenobacter sp. CA2-7]
MNQRYLLPVALLRLAYWERLLGLLLLLGLAARPGQAQTPYALANGDYFENFAGISTWSDGFTSGTGAAPYAPVGVLATGSIPGATRTTLSSSTFVAGTSGGVQKGTSQPTATNALGFLPAGATDNTAAVAVDLLLDFRTREAGQLSFDWATLAAGNTAANAATNTRVSSLRVFASTDGSTFQELAGAAVLNKTNNTPNGTLSAYSSVAGVALPASFTNSATARLRFYVYNGDASASGSTGNRPKVLITNVGVTSLPLPTITSLSPGSLAAGGGGGTVLVNGLNFTPGSVVSYNGVGQATTYVSATQLQITLAAADVATQGNYPVTVANGTKVSNTVNLVVAGAYYTKATGNLNELSTYGTNPDGSGPAPTSFSTPAQVLHVNGAGRTIAGTWTVSGAGAKVVLDAGAGVVIPAAYNFTGPLDLGPATTFEVNTVGQQPGAQLGTLDASSTVVFAQADAYVVPVVAGPGYGSLVLRSAAKSLASGTFQVQRNLVLDNITGFGGTSLSLGGSLTLLGPVSFDASRRLALTTTNPNAQQTLSGNGVTLELLSLTTAAGTPGVALAASTNLLLGGPGGGGYALAAGSQLSVGANTLSFLPGGQASIGAGTGVLSLDPASVLVFNKTGPAPLGTLRVAVGFDVLAGLTLNASGGASPAANDLTLGSSLQVGGPLTLTSGQLTIGSNTLSLNGPVVTGTPGVAQFNGSTSSSLYFGGMGAIGTLAFAAGTGSSLNNLTLNHTAPDTVTARVVSTLTVYGQLTLNRGSLKFTDANRLIVNSAAANIGGGPVSYVNALTRPFVTNASSPTSSVAFPLGGGAGSYRPLTLTITGNTGTTYYTIRQTERGPTSRTDPATLKTVSDVRYFTITRESGSNVSVTSSTVNLTYGADDGVTNPPGLRVARTSPTDPTMWEDLGGTGSGNNTAGTVLSAAFANLGSGGDFVLAAAASVTGNPLPVALTAFGGQRQPDGTVLLTWRTATELNNAYFELERSRDGLTFGRVAQVPGQGSSNLPTSYRYLDPTAPVDQLYYRLRQVDATGQAAYSTVVAVGGAGAVAALGVYPNPATSQLTLLLPAAAVGQPVQVLDLSGRRVALPSGLYPTELDVSQLAAGTYLVQVGAGGAGLTRRFVKL